MAAEIRAIGVSSFARSLGLARQTVMAKVLILQKGSPGQLPKQTLVTMRDMIELHRNNNEGLFLKGGSFENTFPQNFLLEVACLVEEITDFQLRNIHGFFLKIKKEYGEDKALKVIKLLLE
jgi:DNA-binding transcriptional regulator WhiA